MKRSAIRIICFMLILAITLHYVNKIFKVKYVDGIYSLTKFYELQDNTVDVLILGSSHAFENFNTGTLWDEYGMASYMLGGSAQPMWNTYYYLKEALKTQSPELIVLEGFLVVREWDFDSDSGVIKNNYGLKWSPDKIASIKISSPEERHKEFLMEYMQYHTRYRELGSGDFLKNMGDRLLDDWKGFGCNMATDPLESIDVRGVTERSALYREKTEKYYRAVIELAKEREIPIVVVISPYAGINAYEQQKYNTAGDIAAEYNVPFINCNLHIDEIGLDYATDAADVAHLNHRGNQKFTSYIGQYLKNNFEISNRTGDKKYDTWQRDADVTRQLIKDQILTETYDINAIVEKLQDPNYWIVISVDGNCSTSDEYLKFFFEQMGMYGEGLNGIWLKTGNSVDWYSGMGETKQFIKTSLHDFCLKRSQNESGQYTNTIIYDKITYQKVANGVNVVVFDKMTEKICDTFGINMDDNYNIVR